GPPPMNKREDGRRDGPPAPPGKRDDSLPPAAEESGHDGGFAPGANTGSPVKDVLVMANEFLRRTAAPNPATIKPTRDEDERLTNAGLTDPLARKFALWRRAVLWVAVVPNAFAAFFGFINAIAADSENLSGFGVFIVYVEALALFALPTFA